VFTLNTAVTTGGYTGGTISSGSGITIYFNALSGTAYQYHATYITAFTDLPSVQLLPNNYGGTSSPNTTGSNIVLNQSSTAGFYFSIDIGGVPSSSIDINIIAIGAN
jgi:hypothetical protein